VTQAVVRQGEQCRNGSDAAFSSWQTHNVTLLGRPVQPNTGRGYSVWLVCAYPNSGRYGHFAACLTDQSVRTITPTKGDGVDGHG
jgi:hypothetical protein